MKQTNNFYLKIILVLFCSFLISKSSIAQINSNSHYVKPHYRSGTYVKGYYRTNPNSTINDNYSTKPNINPYTGKKGTITPSSSTTRTNSNKYRVLSEKETTEYIRNLRITPNILYDYDRAIAYHNNKYSKLDRYQIELYLFNNNLMPGIVDGIFTKSTIDSIKKFQRLSGIKVDGYFGQESVNRTFGSNY